MGLVSEENLLGYTEGHKLGHDNSIKSNTFLSYYKGPWYGHQWVDKEIPIDPDPSGKPENPCDKCKENQECKDGKCYDIPPGAPECDDQNPCKAPKICVNGHCVDDDTGEDKTDPKDQTGVVSITDPCDLSNYDPIYSVPIKTNTGVGGSIDLGNGYTTGVDAYSGERWYYNPLYYHYVKIEGRLNALNNENRLDYGFWNSEGEPDTYGCVSIATAHIDWADAVNGADRFRIELYSNGDFVISVSRYKESGIAYDWIVLKQGNVNGIWDASPTGDLDYTLPVGMVVGVMGGAYITSLTTKHTTVTTSTWESGTSYETTIIHDWTNGTMKLSRASDGLTVTIKDRNLGADDYYYYGDESNPRNQGYIYQWGNNHPFPSTGDLPKTSSTKPSIAGVGPSEYNSDTYIVCGQYDNFWGEDDSLNLWGDVTDTLNARRGPCSEGWHIPTTNELNKIRNDWGTLTGLVQSDNGNVFMSHFKIPCASYYKYEDGTLSPTYNKQGAFRSSTIDNNYRAKAMMLWSGSKDGRSGSFWIDNRYLGDACNIRPFKNVPVAPDNSWTVVYDGSSTAAGAGIFWDGTNGMISMSTDGINWQTIADKNVGANNVGDTGYFYQYGNNYGFSGSFTKSSTKPDVSGYGPSNPYSNSTFITGGQRWTGFVGADLWGAVTGTEEARQGPCPKGWHIPSMAELKALSDILFTRYDAYNRGSNFWVNGFVVDAVRRDWTGAVAAGDDVSYYWSSDIVNAGESSRYVDITGFYGMDTSNGYSNRIRGMFIRPFKNNVTMPVKYTIRFLNFDGTVLQSSRVVAGSTPEYTGSTPTKPGDQQYVYTFDGWDSPIVAATGNKDYTATYVEKTILYSGNGGQILHNISGQEITLIKTNGEELTIMDRNLGATAYRGESGASAADTYGNLYQWGNNYGFPNSGTVTTSNVQVDASGNSWQNPINSSTFIYGNSNWMNPSNGDLWGKTEGTEVSRQGPCPNGWHVPSKAEMDRLLSMYQSITGIPSTGGYVKFEQYLLFTYPGYRRNQDGNVASQGQSYNGAHLLTNDINQQLYYGNSWWYYNSYGPACGNPIRPFKNTTT